MLSSLLNYLNRSVKFLISLIYRPKKILTFTYYVPAPPVRKTGYRESEFDSIFFNVVNSGYKLTSMKTVSHSRENQGGFWIICVLETRNSRLQKTDINYNAEKSFESKENPSYNYDITELTLDA